MCGDVCCLICFVESSWSAHGDANSDDQQIMTLFFFVNGFVSSCLQDALKGFKGVFLEASVGGFSQCKIIRIDEIGTITFRI